jgi:hypothetical protein
MLNFMALYWPHKALKKWIPMNLESQFGANVSSFSNVNVLPFISNLGQNNKPKMLKVGL